MFVGHKLKTPDHLNEIKIKENTEKIKHSEAIRYQVKREMSDRLLALNTSMGDLDEILDNFEASIQSKASSLRASLSAIDHYPGNIPTKDRKEYWGIIKHDFNNRDTPEPIDNQEVEGQNDNKEVEGQNDNQEVEGQNDNRKIRKLKKKKHLKRKLKGGVQSKRDKLVLEIKNLQKQLKEKKGKILLRKTKF